MSFEENQKIIENKELKKTYDRGLEKGIQQTTELIKQKIEDAYERHCSVETRVGKAVLKAFYLELKEVLGIK